MKMQLFFEDNNFSKTHVTRLTFPLASAQISTEPWIRSFETKLSKDNLQ